MRNKLECPLPDYDYYLEKKRYKYLLFIKEWLRSFTIDGASEMCKTK